MSTTIRISETTKNELDLTGRKGETYEEIILRNINYMKKFNNEKEFHEWFENNYNILGFDEIIQNNYTKFPDFVLKKDDKEVRVELETLSSNFILHGHDSNSVDLVICIMKDVNLPIQVVEISPFKFEQTKQVSVSIDDDEYYKLEKFSNETGLPISKIVSLRLKGYEITKRTAAQEQQEPEKSDDDFEDMRVKWFIKNQQRILETTGKLEPNWNNILTKNPELGFKNARELKNWILSRVLSKANGQAEQTTDH